MKRRTLKRLRPGQLPEHHHNVYVVLLEPAVGKIRKVRAENPKRNPKKPCIYVGMTGLTPEERFANHKAGTKAAAVVKRYGLRLMPECGGVSGARSCCAASTQGKDHCDAVITIQSSRLTISKIR